MNTTTKQEFKVELANKIRAGRAIGNLYGVGIYVNGCRHGWALVPQEDEAAARDFARAANLAAQSVG